MGCNGQFLYAVVFNKQGYSSVMVCYLIHIVIGSAAHSLTAEQYFCVGIAIESQIDIAAV